MSGSKAVHALSGVVAPPHPAAEGIILTDMSLVPIGADAGALDILTQMQVQTAAAAGQFIRLPSEIARGLGTRKTGDFPSAKLRFRIGTFPYTCSVFVVRLWDNSRGEFVLALYIQKEPSVTDAITQIAAEFHLSDREEQVLNAIASGLTSKETAHQMHIAPSTVKSFSRNVMLKLGIPKRASLVELLLRYANKNESRSSYSSD